MSYGESFYLPGATVPEPFLAADRALAREHINDPKPVKEPIEIPMPFIKGCSGANDPIIVTEDWYLKQKRKKLAKKSKDKRDMQIEMMQLLGARDVLKAKLGELDPGKKRDAKKIVNINIKLKNIDAELQMLQEQSGIDMDDLDHGTRVGRFLGRLKRAGRKVVKKIKKFCHRNSELVTGIISLIIPTMISVLIKGIAKIFIK